MAKFIKNNVKVEATAVLELDEDEIAAIDALIGYGIDPFLKHFYEKLGQSYLQPHEAGLRSFFEGVSGASSIVQRAADARHALRPKAT